jgi:hypothetical protein
LAISGGEHSGEWQGYRATDDTWNSQDNERCHSQCIHAYHAPHVNGWEMKTYSQLLEDIELVSGFPRTTKGDMRYAQMDFEHNAYGKNLGKIHKDYSLHRSASGRKLHITHDPSGKVVGQVAVEPGKNKKDLKVVQLNIDREHTKKKIGHSLAVGAYKHLHKTGHTVHAGTEQSPGGASVWKELMRDPETKRHVHAVHRPFGKRGKQLGQASKLHTGDIWTSGSGEARRAGSRKGIKMHKYGTPRSERAMDVGLVLKPKPRTARKK